ncbi:MAG: PaaI family thioesterase [Desulfomicrobium sp.]|jgi:uncharacterized protein (TIGR00369 family)|nr:PaaI family thioesterase [Desulfomicrobium sp.]
MTIPVQHQYADNLRHCYGCGKNNQAGLQIKTHWDGREGKATFVPRPEHIAVPGYVYGGLLASLVDCHGVATAAASVAPPGQAIPRFVTASLHVDFLRPTPLGPELELRAWIKEQRGKKIVVQVEISTLDQVRVQGEVVAAPMPKTMGEEPKPAPTK